MRSHDVDQGMIGESVSSSPDRELYLIQVSDDSQQARAVLTRKQVVEHMNRLWVFLAQEEEARLPPLTWLQKFMIKADIGANFLLLVGLVPLMLGSSVKSLEIMLISPPIMIVAVFVKFFAAWCGVSFLGRIAGRK